MNSNNAALIVPPDSGVANLATNDIRAVRPPVEIPSEWAWVLWLLAGVLAAAAVGYVWWRRRHQPAAPAAPCVPAHVRARQRLEAALPHIHDARLFCTLVSDTIRQYLEERFQFHAPERTTEEFLGELAGTSLLAPDQKDALAEFLEQCDLVKFARLEPHEASLRAWHAGAGRLIDETQYEDATGPEPMRAEPAVP
jgi:hypothetical protein